MFCIIKVKAMAFLLSVLFNTKKPSGKKVSLFIIGVLIPLAFGSTSFFAGAGKSITDISPWYYILFVVIGILISLTQLIPGLSATVLLMIFGYYTALLTGVKEIFESPEIILVYVALVVGFVIGTLLFSKIINYLLNAKRKMFFFTICGLSLGSMVSVFIGSDCLEIYRIWTKSTAVVDLIIGAVALALGFSITFVLYLYDKKRENQAEK